MEAEGAEATAHRRASKGAVAAEGSTARKAALQSRARRVEIPEKMAMVMQAGVESGCCSGKKAPSITKRWLNHLWLLVSA